MLVSSFKHLNILQSSTLCFKPKPFQGSRTVIIWTMFRAEEEFKTFNNVQGRIQIGFPTVSEYFMPLIPV